MMRRFAGKAMLCAALGASSPAWAEDAAPLPAAVPVVSRAVLLDRLSLVLTGLPATDAQKKAFLSGEKPLVALADEMRQSPRFVTRYANYWQRVLQINALVDFLHVKNHEETHDPGFSGQTGPVPYELSEFLSDELYAHYPDPKKNTNLQWWGACGGAYLVNVIWRGYGSAQNPISRLGYGDEEHKDLLCHTEIGGGIPNLDYCERVIEVAPFWNPATKVRVCRGAVRPERCGPDLSKCFPDGHADQFNGEPANNYIANIRASFTFEPTHMIARTIAEDRPWTGIMTGTQGLANGAGLHFIRNFGRFFLKWLPEGAYPDRDKDPTFTKADPQDTGMHWVEKGPGHAGVLSTLAFHRTTNGFRAKFNRVYNAFLCREFRQLEADQESSEETDLTKRPGCRDCHRTLEPAAKFFEKWLAKGDSNFYYAKSKDITAEGTFAGVTDRDVTGLAKILVAQDDFYGCSVKRGFEFLTGREMDRVEAETMLPVLAKELRDGNNMWSVMRKIIGSPAFRGPYQVK